MSSVLVRVPLIASPTLMSGAGKRVYAAGKVAKVRELRARLAAPPGLLEAQARDRARLDDYRQSLVTLEQVRPRPPPPLGPVACGVGLSRRDQSSLVRRFGD